MRLVEIKAKFEALKIQTKYFSGPTGPAIQIIVPDFLFLVKYAEELKRLDALTGFTIKHEKGFVWQVYNVYDDALEEYNKYPGSWFDTQFKNEFKITKEKALEFLEFLFPGDNLEGIEAQHTLL